MMAMEPDEEKLAELVLYVAREIVGDPTGGATKINKILYNAEFSHVRAHGRPITGAPYQKLANGPAPRRLVPIRDRLIQEGSAELRKDDYFGYPFDRIVPLRDVRAEMFTESERRMTDQVIQALWGKTASEVSRISHEEPGWQMVNEGEDIPYSTAFLAKRVVLTDAIHEHALKLAQKLNS